MTFIAYFDPSAGSLMLQAIVGGIGGLGVVVRFLWIQASRSKSRQQSLEDYETVPDRSNIRKQ